MARLSTLLRISRPKLAPIRGPTTNTFRGLSTTSPLRQNLPPGSPPRYNFYRTHGRAFLKTFTLAFLTMQVVQWAWLVFETEEEKDAKNAQILELQSEVRLLDEGRGSHRLKANSEEED